jgi:hypothetical protein
MTAGPIHITAVTDTPGVARTLPYLPHAHTAPAYLPSPQ